MSQSPLQSDFVELIVREVIRRLREHGVVVATAGESTASSAAKAATPIQHELTLTEKLITLETLRNRLTGVRTITVGKRAIVTPAVRDELKHKKIELVRK